MKLTYTKWDYGFWWVWQVIWITSTIAVWLTSGVESGINLAVSLGALALTDANKNRYHAVRLQNAIKHLADEAGEGEAVRHYLEGKVSSAF